MAGPDGALGATFKVVRILQALSLIAVIGMAANFISQMVQHNNAPSDVLVGTLSVVSRPESVEFLIAWTRAKCPNLDLRSCAVLRHYLHTLCRQYPTLPDQHRHGQHAAHCVDRGGRGRWEASLLPKLPSHWIVERVPVNVPAGPGTEEGNQ
ncbi:MAG: hypothetical protein Q9196_001445 [Gyalolechia fulgens]